MKTMPKKTAGIKGGMPLNDRVDAANIPHIKDMHANRR